MRCYARGRWTLKDFRAIRTEQRLSQRSQDIAFPFRPLKTIPCLRSFRFIRIEAERVSPTSPLALPLCWPPTGGASVSWIQTSNRPESIFCSAWTRRRCGHSLNDYLWGICHIKETAHDVTPRLSGEISGRVFLIPSSMKAGDIARVLREGYDVGVLRDGFHELIEALKLDVLMIDTHPGLNEETLLSIALSDASSRSFFVRTSKTIKAPASR